MEKGTFTVTLVDGTQFGELELNGKGSSNAPMFRAVTLSSVGILSGRPTTAGMYQCEFTVSTNWVSTTKTVKITVA